MKEKTNKQFMVLSVIGIVVMLICHLAREYFNYLKAFPFIVIFIFISGYFYKPEKEDNLWKYTVYKFKKLMIPFFIINFIYGIIVNIFKSAGVVGYGSPINLYTLFIQPFINNSQYIFNFPAWFVPTLFLVTICYSLIHKVTGKMKVNEYVLLTILCVLNILTVYFKDAILTQQWTMIILKLFFFLPFFHFGYLYKNKLQEYDEKVPDVVYIIICGGINILIFKIFGNLVYDMHDFADFETNTIFLPLITSIISILFYLRIAKVLTKWIGDNKIVNYISNNTSAIMTHHLFVIFLFNFTLYLINFKTPVPYFDMEIFKKGWICRYEVPGWIYLQQILYVILGIVGPLLFHFIYDKMKMCFLKKFSKKEKI